jgi:hypothetical protein
MSGAVMNDTVLNDNAMKCLIKNFGIVDTERFISNINRERFDYTEWQRSLYDGMTVDEILDAASKWAKKEDSRV